MNVGRITINIVNTPAIKLFPAAPWLVRPNIWIKKISPNIPNKILGVAPKESIKNNKVFFNLPSLANSLKYIAIRSDKGKPIPIAIKIISKVLTKA